MLNEVLCGLQGKPKLPKKFAEEKITLKDCFATDGDNSIQVGKFIHYLN